MNPPVYPPPLPAGRARWRAWHLAAALALVAAVWAILGAASFFRLGSPTRTIEKTIAQSEEWGAHKRFSVSLGFFSTALARAGLSFVQMPSEARSAISSLRGVELGVYRTEREPTLPEKARMLNEADSAMRRRGWSRVVGVTSRDELVAVYVQDSRSSKTVRACWVAAHGRDLVFGSVSARVEPLAAVSGSMLRQNKDQLRGLCGLK